MKKLLLIILSVVVVSSAFAETGDFDSKAVISGWKFAPVQLTILPKENAQLFDGKTPSLTAFGLLGVAQSSAVMSLAPFNELHNNYGVQIAPVVAGGRNNYGISIGFYTTWDKCYGIQIGILNNIENIVHQGDKLSIVGMNIADFTQIGILNAETTVQCGMINGHRKGYFQVGTINWSENNSFQLGLLNAGINSHIQIGIINAGGKENRQFGLYNVQDNGFQFGLFNVTPGTENFEGKTSFQLGLLNYNENALTKWMPFFNFGFEKEENK
jgi:hypothetical protein